MVEPRGFEPLTSSMPLRRAPNCATAPGNAHGTGEGPLCQRGQRPMTKARAAKTTPTITVRR